MCRWNWLKVSPLVNRLPMMTPLTGELPACLVVSIRYARQLVDVLLREKRFPAPKNPLSVLTGARDEQKTAIFIIEK